MSTQGPESTALLPTSSEEPPKESIIPQNGMVEINSDNLDQFLAQKEKWLPQITDLWIKSFNFIENQQEVIDIIEKRIRQNIGTLYLRLKDSIPVSSFMITPFIERHRNKETGEMEETVHSDLPEACYLANDPNETSNDSIKYGRFFLKIIGNIPTLFIWVDLGAPNAQRLIHQYHRLGFQNSDDENGSWKAVNKYPLLKLSN